MPKTTKFNSEVNFYKKTKINTRETNVAHVRTKVTTPHIKIGTCHSHPQKYSKITQPLFQKERTKKNSFVRTLFLIIHSVQLSIE